MNKTRRYFRIVALVFLAGAAVAWFWSYRILHSYQGALREPIRVEEGFSFSKPFTVDIPETYYVNIECRKTIPFDDLDHLLREELDVDYAVVEGEHELIAGHSSQLTGAAYSRDYVSRGFAKFDGIPGRLYTLRLRATRSLPAIASTQPVVKIALAPSVFTQGHFKAALYIYSSIALATVSLGCFVGNFGVRHHPGVS